MTQVNFYHLTKNPIDKALPRLLEKVIAAGHNVVVKTANDSQVEEVNKYLWTYTTKVFLPHGSKKDGFSDQQPIYITSEDENPNKATVFAMVYGAECTDLNAYEKCIYMFDAANNDEVALARQRWQSYKDLGVELEYWQQTPKGVWEKKQ